ncbi:F-box only protein 36b [Nematolebias whitei]|uniref:F-box only protein 36b n=1 Tax=Nematolebias whitei TaxID=451745 RepID=UPI001898B413|nr:F-box only protein 36b [Nematolebias whitei]
MVSILPDLLFDISGRGPPPNTNFYHFSVTKSQVIWRWWKISPRAVDRHSKPGEERDSHPDFLDDTWMQSEVSMVFGPNILQFTKALCQGRYDYLERLSDSLLLRIISYLELEDVGQLGRTSHRFRKLCVSEEFWEQAVRRRLNIVSAEVTSLALEVGWRSVFFTNKLQLQKLLSRRRQRQEDHVSDSEAEDSSIRSSEKSHPADSEEESLSDPIHHPDPHAGAAVDSSSCCDADPDPEGGSASTEVLTEDTQNSTQSSEDSDLGL